MKDFQMNKIVLFLFLNFVLYSSYSQNLHLIPDVKSPNVSNFETYGNVPVNLFTGTPNISVPIYTLQSGSIQVPINLSYHPSNVKPAVQPGWVGFGWSLNPGGVITRKVNGTRDEHYVSLGGNHALYPSYYPFPSPHNGIESGSEIINNSSSWDSENTLKNHIIPGNNSTIYDYMADEFNFSFNGYSGKFIYSGPTKGWQIISDQKIKVELLESEFLDPYDIYPIIRKYIPFSNRNVLSRDQDQSRYFRGFRITTPDGTVYEFGGVNGVELSSPYAYKFGAYEIDTWLLTKITDINNNIVEFNYKRTYPTCNLGFSASASSGAYSYSIPGTGGSNFSFTTANINELYGNYQWPLYLEKISSSTTDVLFSSNTSNGLVYTRPDIPQNRTGQLRKPNSVQYDTDSFYHVNDDTENIQWEQLNTIEVKDKSKNDYPIKMIHEFTYSNNSNKRLTLESYEKSGANDDSRSRYEFEYNEMNAYDGITCDGNYSDHWGYFNGQNANNSTVASVNSKKNVNPGYLLKGLLEKITYPTGGFTIFEWEPHDYSQVVSPNRQQLESTSGTAGGVRIQKIKSYLEGSSLASPSQTKNYYYKKNYRNNVNLSSLNSCGILNVIPQYSFVFTNRPNNVPQFPGNSYYELASFNSITSYGYTGQGSHIGYDEVTEENMNGSYTKHYFTSYGEDKNGKFHFDRPPAGSAGFLPSVDRYMPYSFLDLERGKEVGVYKYNNNEILVEKSITKYRDDDSRFNSNNYIRRIPWGLRFTYLAIIAGIEEYTYSYYPIRQETTTYDLNGNNPIVSFVDYTYNSSNQITEQTTISSSNKELKTQYKYPADYSSSPYPQMVSANYIAPVIESVQSESNSQVNLTKTNYTAVNDLFLPTSIENQKGSSDPVIINMEVLRNGDVNGNILEYSVPDGTTNVLIWGHCNQFPIAKIENATFSEVASELGITVNELKKYNERNIGSINSLRDTLTRAMITTYTYDSIFGIRSITGPKGKSSYYYYDDFGRLSYVRDNEGEILSYNKYHYKN